MKNKYFKVFVWIHFLLSVLLIIYTAFIIYQTNQYMYFGGFGSLFMLILLIPYIILLFCNMLLLFLSLKLKKRVLMIITLFLQIIYVLLWMFMMYLFHSTIPYFEFIMILQIITAITLLCFLWEKNDI